MSAAQSTPQGSDWPGAPAPQANPASCVPTVDHSELPKNSEREIGIPSDRPTVFQGHISFSPDCKSWGPAVPQRLQSPGRCLRMSSFPGIPLVWRQHKTIPEWSHILGRVGFNSKVRNSTEAAPHQVLRENPCRCHHPPDALAPGGRNCSRTRAPSRLPSPGQSL